MAFATKLITQADTIKSNSYQRELKQTAIKILKLVIAERPLTSSLTDQLGSLNDIYAMAYETTIPLERQNYQLTGCIH